MLSRSSQIQRIFKDEGEDYLYSTLELDTHSSLEADPSESSSPLVSVAPMVLPFLCSNDSESDTEIPERHVSPIPHDAMLTSWRSRVASRSSSPTTSTLEIPTALILLAPSAIDIPIGRLYCTHPGGPCRALTSRKSVRPLPSHRLALRHSILGYSLSEHTPPNTTDTDSSTPQRFVHPSLARTPRCSEAYLRWRSDPLSTMYPPTTFESSAGDSSSESFAGPSRKRCRSSAATVTSSIHATRALVPSHADILPPRKRFRDSISPEDSVEEDIDTDVLEDIEADATTVEVAVDRDVEARVDAGIDMEVDVGDEVKDEVESSDRGTMEVGIDVVAGVDIPNVLRYVRSTKFLEFPDNEKGKVTQHNASSCLSPYWKGLLNLRTLSNMSSEDWIDRTINWVVLPGFISITLSAGWQSSPTGWQSGRRGEIQAAERCAGAAEHF
ncbi:hypothetical protein Tco_0849377 [Tanacetum coccineum]